MFNKNLEFINNEPLKRRLLKISTADSRLGISYCITPSNDYILLKDEIPLDDLTNPRAAIKKIINENIKNDMQKNDIIINFGIGLGYLLDETFNQFPSRIYIYEPDLKLLHFVLHNVDISEHLASGRVYITNDLDELITYLTSTYLVKDKVEILYLNNYALVKNKELLMLTQRIFDACKTRLVDINTITKFSHSWMLNTIENFVNIRDKNGYLLSDLEDKFVGQKALIVASGPSLADNILKIKENRNKFVIFAVNKSVRYLIENDIVPDFVVCLDAHNMEKTIGGLNESLINTNCIMDIRTDKTLVNRSFNKVFYNFSESDFLMKKVAKYNKFLKFYETGGSAATFALVCAIKMGFSKIIFAGLDLAFKNEVIYSTGEKMNRISQEQLLVDNVKKNIVQVPAVNGGMVYTRDDYKTFINHFEILIRNLEHKEIYNLTTFGAKIEGVKSIKFEDLELNSLSSLSQLDYIGPFKLDLKSFFDEEFCQINNIISILSKGLFSPVLLNAIVKSVFVYQYLQSDVLNVLQRNFDTSLADDFIAKTKIAIKNIVSMLQNNKLI